MRVNKFLRILVTVKNSLASAAAREFYIFMFFVVVSAGFWLIKTLQETYEAEVAVPLMLTDVPENVVITHSLADTIFVKVRDRGTVLLGLQMQLDDNPLQISFSDFATRQSVGTVRLNNMAKRLQSHISNATTILSMRPDTMSFSYNRGVSRRVPVRIASTIGTHPQYCLDGVTITPDTVTVYAPQKELDGLKCLEIDVDGCAYLQNDTDVVVTLPHVELMKYVPGTVDVHVEVDLYTEKKVRVPVTGVNFPPDRHLRTFPASVEVTFRVGTKKYSSITANDFVLAVPYEELKALPTGARWHVHANGLPEGASNPRFVPADVEYLIESTAAE